MFSLILVARHYASISYWNVELLESTWSLHWYIIVHRSYIEIINGPLPSKIRKKFTKIELFFFVSDKNKI